MHMYSCVRREVQRWHERATVLRRGGEAGKCDLERDGAEGGGWETERGEVPRRTYATHMR